MAQPAFNDAFEAGLVTKNTPVGPSGRVTVSRPPSSGDEGPGIFYVQEHAPRKSTAPVDGHEFSYAPKAEMVTSGKPMPALGYKKGGATGNSYMRFNDVNPSSRRVYDTDWSSRGTEAQKDDVQNKVEALRQNPGWSLVVEVPDRATAGAAAALYDEAVKVVRLGEAMPIISIVIAPPKAGGPQLYDGPSAVIADRKPTVATADAATPAGAAKPASVATPPVPKPPVGKPTVHIKSLDELEHMDASVTPERITELALADPGHAVSVALKKWGDDKTEFSRLIVGKDVDSKAWQKTIEMTLKSMKPLSDVPTTYRGWKCVSAQDRLDFMSKNVTNDIFKQTRVGMSGAKSVDVATRKKFHNSDGMVWEIRNTSSARDVESLFKEMKTGSPDEREVIFPRGTILKMIKPLHRRPVKTQDGWRIVWYAVFEDITP